MSGGSLDYVCYKVSDAADSLESRAKTIQQLAFAKHLRLVGDALHDIEWVLSGDYGKGDEVEAIAKVITPQMELECAIELAVKAQADLAETIERSKNG